MPGLYSLTSRSHSAPLAWCDQGAGEGHNSRTVQICLYSYALSHEWVSCSKPSRQDVTVQQLDSSVLAIDGKIRFLSHKDAVLLSNGTVLRRSADGWLDLGHMPASY